MCVEESIRKQYTFTRDTEGLDSSLEHQVIVHGPNDNKRYFISSRKANMQEVTASRYVLRGLEFGKIFQWTVRTLDPSGTTVRSSQAQQFIYDPFGLWTALPGDVNNDKMVDIADAILALQVSAGIETESMIYYQADVNGDGDGDGQLGRPEALFVFQETAGLRP